MDLKDYLSVLWRRKWIIVVSILAALAVAVIGTRSGQPAYQATATVRVAVSAVGPITSPVLTYSTHLINTAAEIAASKPMRDKVMSQLQLKEQPVITAVAVLDTELIKITVEYSNPQTAARIANSLADMLIAESQQIYVGGKVTSQDILAQQLANYKADLDATRRQYDSLVSGAAPLPASAAVTLDLLQVKERNYQTLLLQYNDAILQQQVQSSMMTLVEPAVAPPSPIRPDVTYNYLVGLAIGLLVGVVLAFVANSFDSTLFGTRAVENAAGLSILATIPKASRNGARISANDQSPLAEAFRSLALSIMSGDREQPGKVVLILSGETQQGKSTVAANLATALAEYGKSTIAVDCDMRRPKLHKLFDLSNDSGLRNILEGDSDLQAELRHAGEHLNVITSGGQPANPSQLLSSPNMARLIGELRKQFDVVVLDTPALLAVSDTTTLAQNIKLAQNGDVCALVVRDGRSARESVHAAARFVDKLPHQVAGVVLNEAGVPVSTYYYRPVKAQKAQKAPVQA